MAVRSPHPCYKDRASHLVLASLVENFPRLFTICRLALTATDSLATLFFRDAAFSLSLPSPHSILIFDQKHSYYTKEKPAAVRGRVMKSVPDAAAVFYVTRSAPARERLPSFLLLSARKLRGR